MVEDRLKVCGLNLCLKKIEEAIALTSKEGIALTLGSRLSADYHQNLREGKAESRLSKLDLILDSWRIHYIRHCNGLKVFVTQTSFSPLTKVIQNDI